MSICSMCQWWWYTNKVTNCIPWEFQPDSAEYSAACRLWELFLSTRSDLLGDQDDGDDDDDDDTPENPGTSAEDEVNKSDVILGGAQLESTFWINIWLQISFLGSHVGRKKKSFDYSFAACLTIG